MPCSSDFLCPSGYDCVGGECVPSGHPSGCTSDHDCPPGYVCDWYSGQCVPQEQWYQYQTTTTKTHTVKAVVKILSDLSGERTGIGSFQIKMDDKEAGSVTSGQEITGKLNAGTCYQTYLGSTTGYTQYQGEQCQNEKSSHKVELVLPVGTAGNQKCPTGEGRCFLDPRDKNTRYYLDSDPVQYKGDGETAEFVFKIEYLWSFDTVDQNGNHIDLTGFGIGFHYARNRAPSQRERIHERRRANWPRSS